MLPTGMARADRVPAAVGGGRFFCSVNGSVAAAAAPVAGLVASEFECEQLELAAVLQEPSAHERVGRLGHECGAWRP